MALDIYELDDLGIIPRFGEHEDIFLKRGNLTIEMSRGKSDEEIIKLFRGIKDGSGFFPYSSNFVHEAERERVIEYLKNRYGVDLSWVRFCIMIPSASEYPLMAGGLCLTSSFVGEEVEIMFPAIAIFSLDSIRHELIHGARSSLNKKREEKEEEEFEEDIARSKYFKSFLLSFDSKERMFAKVRRKLQKYFGDQHGYVFIRLNYWEIVQHILPQNPPYGNPTRYLRRMSEYYLKHRIMCEKLDLWKYDFI